MRNTSVYSISWKLCNNDINFQTLNQTTMGRAARNHGGTGGHGCLPFSGERPNYHKHVMSDTILLNLVAYDKKKQGKPKDVGFQHALASAEHPVTSPKPPLSSPNEVKKKRQIEPKVIGFAFASAKQPDSSAEQLESPCKLPLKSTNNSVTPTKLPLTSTKQSVSSPKEAMNSTKQPVTYSKQSLTSLNEVKNKKQVEPKDIGFQLKSTKTSVTSPNLPVASPKQPMFSTKQLETLEDQQTSPMQPLEIPGQLPVISVNEPFASVNQCEFKEPTTSMEPLLSSSCHQKTSTLPEQQHSHLPVHPVNPVLQFERSGLFTDTSVQYPVISVNEPFSSVNQSASAPQTLIPDTSPLTPFRQPLITSNHFLQPSFVSQTPIFYQIPYLFSANQNFAFQVLASVSSQQINQQTATSSYLLPANYQHKGPVTCASSLED